MSQIITYNNILNPIDRETRATTARNRAEILAECKIDPMEYETIICKNSEIMEGDFEAQDGDVISVSVIPRGGGGGGGKDIARVALQIALVVAVSYFTMGAGAASTAAFFGTTTGSVTMYAIAATAMIAGTMLINAVLPPSMADFGSISGSLENLKNSTTYGWDTRGNPTQQGGALPKIFGTHKVTPPIISKYVESIDGKQYLNLLFALNDGLITNVTDIKINNETINNFYNVTYDVRNGSVSQALIPNFADTRYDVPVNKKLTTSFTTVTSQGNSLNEFGLTLVFPRGLFYANDSGGLSGLSVKLVMEYSANGTDWVYFGEKTTVSGYSEIWRYVSEEGGSYYAKYDSVNGSFLGVTSTSLPNGAIWISGEGLWSVWYGVPYTYTYDYTTVSAATSATFRKTYKVSNLTAGQYYIRVRFYEAPPTGSRYGSDVYLEYVEEAISDDFTYPATALLAVRALATDQLSGGMPTITCNVTSGLTETDVNGNANPADVAKQLLIDCGVPETSIGNSFASWKTYCTENNYTCNIVFDSTINLRKALDLVGMLGRGAVLQFGSTYEVVVDKADIIPVQSFMFGMGNILKNTFKQSFLPLTDRANIVEVTYYDKELDYERTVVEIAQDNYNEVSVENKASLSLIGCVDRDMVIRHGKFLLNCNRFLTETVSFEADIDSLVCRYGDIVRVSHDVPQYGFSGRIVSASTTEVVLDREVTLEAGKTYAVQIKNNVNQVYEYVVINSENTTNTLTFASPIAETFTQYDLYSFGELGKVSKLFRVLKIGTGNELTRTITCLEYVEDVYNDSAIIEAEPVSSLGLSEIRVSEYLKRGSGVIETFVNLGWSGSSLWYDVSYKKSSESLYTTFRVYDNFAEINGLQELTYYDFKITSSSGQTQTRTYKVLGTSTLYPDDVQNLVSFYQNGQTIMRWDAVIDTRGIIDYEIRKGTIWENGNTLGFVSGTNYIITSTGDYMVKARYIDPSGVQLLSENEAQLSIQGAVIPANIVAEIDEYATGFVGAKTNMFVNPDGYLQTSPATMIDDYPLIDSVTNMDWYGGASLTAEYEIPTAHIVDVGEAQLVRIWLEYEVLGANINDYIDFRGYIDDWADIDGLSTDYNMQVQIQVAQNDGVFGAWQNFYAGDYIGRKFNFRALFSTTNPDISIIVKQAKIYIDMEDKIQSDNGIALLASGQTITFPIPFQITPATNITIINAADGDEVKLTNETNTSFDVQVTNGGVGVARSINWISKAY